MSCLLLLPWPRKLGLEPDERYLACERERASMALQVEKEQSVEGCDYWP